MRITPLLFSVLSRSRSSAFNISPHLATKTRFRYAMSSSSALQSSNIKPIAIMVDAEIKPDRLDEFLDLIEKDAVGSRAEQGCIRFVEFTRDYY